MEISIEQKKIKDLTDIDKLTNKLIILKTNSFEKINIKPNSLILCDIDDTLLRYKFNLEYFYKKTHDFLISINDYLDETDTKNIAENEFDDYRLLNEPYHTDKEGWENFTNRLKETNSKLIFITARSKEFTEKTKQQFTQNNVNYDEYDVHYTFEHKMSKASYIEKHININGYSNVYFIDDHEYTVKNVKKTFPNIICYLFKYVL